MLTGLTGKAGSGKTSVARILCEDYGYVESAFADNLKAAASCIFGLDLEHFYDGKLKEVVDPFWNMTPRAMLQKLGTDACRSIFGDDVWIRSAQKESSRVGAAFIVFSDVRFENEAQMIRNHGGLIVHVAGRKESALSAESQGHVSEVGVEVSVDDYIFNNTGTFEQLPREVADLVQFIARQS